MGNIVNNKKIYIVSVVVVITLVMILTVAFAYIGKATSSGNTNAVILIDEVPLTLSYSGVANIALPITLDDLIITNASNSYTSYVSATGKVTINLQQLNTKYYPNGVNCNYTIKYTPTAAFIASSGAVSAGLKELTISGSNGSTSFSEYSLGGVSSAVTLASSTISTSSSVLSTSQTWNFTMKFYNLNVDQQSAIGQNPAGNISVVSSTCTKR